MDTFTPLSDTLFAPTVSLDSDSSSSVVPSAFGDGDPILVDAEYWTSGSSSQSGFCVVV